MALVFVIALMAATFGPVSPAPKPMQVTVQAIPPRRLTRAEFIEGLESSVKRPMTRARLERGETIHG